MIFEKFNTLTEMTTKSGCFYHMRISQKSSRTNLLQPRLAVYCMKQTTSISICILH